MNEIELKKDLYKSKAIAKFSHYRKGELFYNVELTDGIYQFPLSTIETVENFTEIFDKGELLSRDVKFIDSTILSIVERYDLKAKDIFKLSEDLGDTSFDAEIKGSELIRWITKAIKNETIRKIGSKPVKEGGKIIGYQG